MYELIYLATIAICVSAFVLWIVYKVFQQEWSTLIKPFALGGLSLLLVSFGFLISEFAFDYYDPYYNCKIRENVSFTVMLIVLGIIVLLSFSVRRQKYVINRISDIVFGMLFALVVSWYVLFELIL